jgi:hypothetical protein
LPWAASPACLGTRAAETTVARTNNGAMG